MADLMKGDLVRKNSTQEVGIIVAIGPGENVVVFWGDGLYSEGTKGDLEAIPYSPVTQITANFVEMVNKVYPEHMAWMREGSPGSERLELKDGPCKGVYICKRAPTYLRAVKGKDNAGNTSVLDVLDLIDDTPGSGETVYIYEMEGEPGSVHLNFGCGKGGFYAMGTYHYLPDVDGEALRDNMIWQEWAKKRVAGK